MIAMDYRDVGPDGEPRIVHVDQEWDYAVTVLASGFAEFVRGLRAEEASDLGCSRGPPQRTSTCPADTPSDHSPTARSAASLWTYTDG